MEAEKGSNDFQTNTLSPSDISEGDVDEKQETRSLESHSRISKNVSITQNATNSHPLLQDYPDLIPEKPRNMISVESNNAIDTKEEFDIEKQLSLQMPQLDEYNETLPGILFCLFLLKKV